MLDVAAQDAQEREFFLHEPWSNLDYTHVGIPALRSRLRELLMDRTRSELPSVKHDMAEKLKEARNLLAGMGEPHGKPEEQRAYLGKIVHRSSQLVTYGLDAYCTGDPIFIKRDDLRLITRIGEINDQFAAMLFEKAHAIEFEMTDEPAVTAVPKRTGGSIDREVQLHASFEKLMVEVSDRLSETTEPEEQAVVSSAGSTSQENRGSLYDCTSPLSVLIPNNGEDDLDGILSEPFYCEPPSRVPLLKEIKKMHNFYRGYELGTVCYFPISRQRRSPPLSYADQTTQFGTVMTPTTFRVQAEKWESIALAHVSNAVLVVHNFIFTLIEEACPDPLVREPLWSLVLDKLLATATQ